MSTCPYKYPLELLRRKWTFFVLQELRRERGFSDLKHDLRFITSKVLSQELKHLEQLKFIKHELARYAVTERGESFLQAIKPLGQWTVTHGVGGPYAPQDALGKCVGDCTHCAAYEALMRSK